MYNLFEYYPSRRVINRLVDVFNKNNYNIEEFLSLLDSYSNRGLLRIEDNVIKVAASVIASICTSLTTGKVLDRASKSYFYNKIGREAALKIGCSQNNKDYYIELDVGGLEVILFGKPDVFCNGLPGEIKVISSFSPKETEDYQKERGELQAEMYGFIFGLQKAVFILAYYRRYGKNNYSIERIRHKTIGVDKEEIKNIIEFIVSKIIVRYLY